MSPTKALTKALTGKPFTARETFGKLLKPCRLYLDLNARLSAAAVLAGSNRSGTTWMAELLTYGGRYRYINEPFQRGVCRWIASRPGPRRYLRPDVEAPEFREYVRRVLVGRVRHRQLDWLNTSRLPKRRLIKDIHGTLFLKWLRVQFPRPPILYLMRHPCAVASSMLSLKDFFDWDYNRLHEFLDQPQLMADHLEPFRDLIRETAEPFDRAILLWCIENYVPLRMLEPGGARFLFYEQILAAPRDQLPPICEWVGRPYSDEMLERVPVPSQTSWGDHCSIKAGRDPISSWRTRVRPEQVGRALEILRAFGLDAIYNDGSMPSPEGLDRFREGAGKVSRATASGT